MRRNRILKYLVFFSIVLVTVYTLRFKQESWATHELYTELKQEFTKTKSEILKEPIPKFSGNGIVMTLTDKSINLTVLYLNHLQNHLKTQLPIQVFYNKNEFTKFDLLNVEYKEFQTEGYLFQEGSNSIKPFYYKNLAIIQSRLSTYLTQHDKYQQDKRMLYGDKDTFHLSADALGLKYNTVPYVITQVGDYNNGMCGYAMLQKWFDNEPLFLHTNGLKGRKNCAKLDYYSIPLFYLGGMDFDYGGEKGYGQTYLIKIILILFQKLIVNKDFNLSRLGGDELCVDYTILSPKKSVKVDEAVVEAVMDVDQSPVFDESAQIIDLTIDQLKGLEGSESISVDNCNSEIGNTNLDSQVSKVLANVESQPEDFQNLDLELETQEQSEWTPEHKWDNESVIFENTPNDFKQVDDLYFAIKSQLKSFSLELKQEQSRNMDKDATIHKLKESLKRLDSDLIRKKTEYQDEINCFRQKIKKMETDSAVERATTDLVNSTILDSVLLECNSRIDNLAPALKELEYLKKLELKLTNEIHALQSKVAQNNITEQEYLALKSQLETEIVKNNRLVEMQSSNNQQDDMQLKISEIHVLEKIISDLETKNTDKQNEIQSLIDNESVNSGKLEQLVGELELAKQQLDTLIQERESLKLMVQQSNLECEEFKSTNLHLHQQLTEAKSTADSLQVLQTNLQSQLTESNDRLLIKTRELESLQEQLNNDMNSMSSSQMEMQSMLEQTAKLTASLIELEESNNAKQEKLKKLFDEKQSLLNLKDEIEINLDEQKEKLNQSLAQISDLQTELASLKVEKAEFEERMQSLTSEIQSKEQAVHELSQLKDQVEQVRSELEAGNVEKQQLEGDVSTLNGKLTEVEQQLDLVYKEKKELQITITRMQTELEQSSALKTQYEELMSKFNITLEKSNQLETENLALLEFKDKHNELAIQFSELQQKYSDLITKHESTCVELGQLSSIKEKYDQANAELANSVEKYNGLLKQVEQSAEFQQKYDEISLQYNEQKNLYILREEELSAAKEQLQTLESKLQQVEAERSVLVEDSNNLQQELEGNKKFVQDHELKYGLLSSEMAQQVEKYTSLEKDQANLLVELQQSKAELEKYKLNIEELEKDKASIKDELDSKIAKVNQLETQLQQSSSFDLEEKLKELNGEIRTLNDRNITLQAEKSNLEYESSVKDSEIIRLKQEQAQLNTIISEKDDAIQHSNQLTGSIQSLKESIDYLEKEKQKYLETIKFSEQEQHSTNELLEKEMQKCLDYETQLQDLNSKLNSMNDDNMKLQALEAEVEQLKSTSEQLTSTIAEKDGQIVEDAQTKKEYEEMVSKLNAELAELRSSDETHKKNIGKLRLQLQQFQQEYTQVLELNKDLQKEKEQTVEKYTAQSNDLDALQLQNLELEQKCAKYDLLLQEHAKLQEKLNESNKASKQLEALKTQNLELAKSVQSQRNVITNINAELSQVKLASQKAAKKKVTPKMVAIPEVDTPKKIDENTETETESQEKKKRPKRRRESILLDASNDQQEDEEEEECTPMKRKSLEPEETPESQRKTRTRNRGNVYILLSGFKENTPFDGKLRQKLVQCAESLTGVEIIKETEGKAIFDKRTTHVICPPNTRTLKILAASLSGAWIINDPEWLVNSHSKNKLLDESQFGFKSDTNPLQGKKIYKSKSFNDLVNENKGTAYAQYPKFLDVLLRKVSNGCFVTDPDEADYVMEAENDPR
ncbi:hypothetical protein HK103_003218 [Boothiomyces macroporosus]|uniref:BRCT domain-containing protein n=1 Tax=Boothiomyces macroporosus TaxID=261099 RepID=A0AAD5Y4A4_9FUNG|nr:hypothetical protein HK103_003218 [Boothiomyces macroporosus]